MRNAGNRLVAAALLAVAAGVAYPAAVEEYSDGGIQSVDRENRNPLTMPFHVRDARMLERVKPGDKVKFRAAVEGGRFTITEMVPAR